jgi:D-beta-D-heptose 7-phosphate kinase / D-beta-D-heptose 1-phosphate adenosyltransferase
MRIDFSVFDKCRVMVVGDLMLDEYVWGGVERISPEAPVPVLSVTHEELTLGGAGNVAKNLAVLGARVAVAGVVGKGPHGKRLREELVKLGVDVSAVIAEPKRPTTRKTRIIAEHQQVLRIDRETAEEVSPMSTRALVRRTTDLVKAVDVVLISDYGKGAVTRRLAASLAETAGKARKITIADPKGLDYSKYAGLTLITPNKKEAALAAGVEIRDEPGLYAAGRRLLDTVAVEKLLVTCGKEGMVFFERGAEPFKFGTRAQQVYDVSGAGDTVAAALSLGLAAGFSYPDAIRLANTAAGIVVGKVGTAAVTRAELLEALQPSRDPAALKHKSLVEIEDLSRELRRSGKRIVLTNGCFDLLHAGHIRLFAASRAHGDVLVVALDDDASVRELKGRGRPVIAAEERVRILSALDSVDYVVVFPTRRLERVIEAVRPDVLTKGSNYENDTVIGRERVERLGGRVVLIPVTAGLSSSRIIETIKAKSTAPGSGRTKKKKPAGRRSR